MLKFNHKKGRFLKYVIWKKLGDFEKELTQFKKCPGEFFRQSKAHSKIKSQDWICKVNSFEIHIITPEIYRERYSYFIKEKKRI